MKKSYFLVYFILFLVVGFATLTLSFNINGSLNVAFNEEDFNVYFSFASFQEVTDSTIEIIDNNTFSFKPNINVDDKSLTLIYEVVNASTEYDANINVDCTSENKVYTSISNTLANPFIEARDVTEGIIKISLNDEYNGSEDIDEEYTCFLSVDAISRTSIDNSDIERFINIDGEKTNIKEWRTIDLVHETNLDIVYARNDKDYLYLYAENLDNIMFNNTHLYISTDESSSSQIYNFCIENGRIYLYDNGFKTDENGALLPFVDLSILAVNQGLEIAIPLAALNIDSIKDVRSIKLEYLTGEWQVLKTTVIYLSKSDIIVDGTKTYVNEYTIDNLIYEDESSQVYARILNDYIYFYAYDSKLTSGDLVNPSIYVGSKSLNVQKNPSTGFMFWYETTILACDSISCTNKLSNSNKYHPIRAIDDGVEFKFPLNLLDMSNIDDLKVVQILYRDSSWNEVKRININLKDRLFEEDLIDKTYVLVNKPSEWSDIYIYTSGLEWPGNEMSYYGNTNNMYAYIFSDDIDSAYVTFSDNGNSQYPLYEQNIFKIEKGKSRIWDGQFNGVHSWNYVDDSNNLEDKKITFNLKVPDGKYDLGCVYLYDDNDVLNSLNPWPGIKLTKSNDIWLGSIDDISEYDNVRAIFNNCNNGWQVPSSDGIHLKPGMNLGYYNGIYVDYESR